MPDVSADTQLDAQEAESILRSNPEAWLAAIVESSDDAIIGKTLDSVIRSWNEGATRMFGYEAHEAIGQPVYLLMPPELYHEEPGIIARLSRGERVDHFETVRLRKDGARLDVSLSVSPIRNRAGRIIGAAKVVRDITEAKRMQRAEREMAEELQELASELEQQIDAEQGLQQELEETNEQLRRSLNEAQEARRQADEARRQAEEANAAKSQFLATMSHELRTPLNAIAGYVDILEAGVRGPLTREQLLDVGRIKRSEEMLLRLIEDVLNFAKLESGRMEYRYEDVRLSDFLSTLEAFVAPRFEKKHLVYDFGPCTADLVVSIDRAKVEQIMLNLLSNAVKFTDHGRIEVRCAGDDTTVRIEVRDTGRGIRPEILDTIFEPFVQGDRTFTRTAEGTGLGLSISRELARAMGGEITVHSTVGQGSVFTLVLPRHRPAAARG
ncbi:MAG TPA: ATP-binding protein [Acidobacteriaceae bacterium]|nr:ATP-binding protein [Acidobacteriaceae bacterium]